MVIEDPDLAIYKKAVGMAKKKNSKLKVFILMGQSNMVGFGQVSGSMFLF